MNGSPDDRGSAAAARPGEEHALLERDAELAALEAAIESASAGSGRCVIIEGAPGIGKTSLLRAAAGVAAAAGLRVLSARGSELERALPYGVVRQLFERDLARASPGERELALAGAAGLAAPLLTAGRSVEPGPASEDASFAILHGLYWLAANLAERVPLLVAVDDLHWADSSSVRWIAYLAHRIEGLPLVALATVRPLAEDADASSVDVLADPATLTIRPGPLTRDAAATIVADRLSPGATEEVTVAAYEATGGNPLLLRELVDALAGVRDGADTVTTVRRIAPEVISRRVRLELARLGPEATALARAVAVLGDDVESRHAAALAGLEVERAGREAGWLARARLLERDPPLRFVHPLVRSAVYGGMSAPEREATHERAAELLAADAAPLERVAAQLLLAPAAGSPATVETLREAARLSLASGAAESAIGYLRRALEEPPSAMVRADVLVELAAAESLLGAREAADHLREALPLLDDSRRRAELHLELARALFWSSKSEEQVVAELERALAEAGEADTPLRRVLQAEYYGAALRVPGRYEAVRAGLDDVQMTDEADRGSQMLLALKADILAWRGEQLDVVVTLAERAISAGLARHEAPSASFWGAISALLLADRFDSVIDVIDEVLADARRRGALYLFAAASAVRAVVFNARGALIDAEADARAAVDALPNRRLSNTATTFAVLVAVLVERGLLDEAETIMHRATPDGQLLDSFENGQLLWARSELRLARGDFRGTYVDARACGRAFEAVGVRNPSALPWRSQAALALLGLGDAEEGRRLAAEELELARRWGAPKAIVRALRALGLAEGGEAGLGRHREALAAMEGSSLLYDRARSLIDLGSALRRAGRRVDAREQLRAGSELAERCGAPPLTRQAHEELLAAGARPRSTALTGVASLTPSERRVAAMAAEGMSNREVAQALFVTTRTVEMHLSNSFRKLDISSRTQLADALSLDAAPASEAKTGRG
jgi:DNA-binding CsgD family transcriptional regulator